MENIWKKAKENMLFVGILMMTIFFITVFIISFFMKQPFWFVFAWLIFIIAVPNLWKKFGGGVAPEFWKGILKRAGKTALCIFIFLLIRGYFSHIVDFGLFQTYVEYMAKGSSVAVTYTPPRILFECAFLLLIGSTIIHAVFTNRKKSWALVGSFLVVCFLLQTFAFGLGYNDNTVVKTAAKPISPAAVNAAVEDSGFIGGPVKQLWYAAFGKSKKTSIPQTSGRVQTSIGKTLIVNLEPGQVYTIDQVSQGQSWKYLSFNGSFQHRVDTGNNSACWKLIDNNLPWSADCAGKLQLKAGNTPVTITVNLS